MIKTIITYLLILIGLGLMYISTSIHMMEEISVIRNESKEWWGAHDISDKGDLVNMAYLDNVEKFHSERDYIFHKPDSTQPSNVNLYMEGDSYTFKIPDSAFLGVNKYEYVWVGHDIIRYKLDTSKKNILIVERAERYLMYYLNSLDLLWNVQGEHVPTLYYESRQNAKNLSSAKVLSGIIPPMIDEFFSKLFNGNINQNLEYNLFNYNWLNTPRLAKAALNYQVFNRASGNVTISDNGGQLYSTETTDPKEKGSSFTVIKVKDYENIVHNLNLFYDYYTNQGFDEVYMAMIPNPVSILEPDGYNQLIPRLQNDTSIRMKFIDAYTPFQNADTVIYRPGDTHWYDTGIQIWIDLVNKELKKWNEAP